MRFPSGLLPVMRDKKDETEVRKALADMLAKVNALAASGAAGRTVVFASIDPKSAAYTYQLPAANGTNDITVVNQTGSAVITVKAAGNDKIGLIGGTATYSVPYQGNWIRLVDILGTWILVGGTQVFAPLPQSAAGAGQWKLIVGPTPGALNLPAGGTWAYYAFYEQTSGVAYVTGDPVAGIAAGGTTILTSTGTYKCVSLAYEIQDSSPVDFSQPIYLMPDGSYVVTKTNGYPYNVLLTDPAWPSIQAWLAAGGMATPYVPPAPAPPSPRQQAAATIAAIQQKAIAAQIVGPTVPLGLTAADVAAYKAAQAVLAKAQA